MSESYRVSGKKFPFPQLSQLSKGERQIKFTLRPGGWIIAEMPDGTRKRIAVSESRGHLSAAVGGRLYFGTLSSDRAGQGTAAGAGDSDLIAQFPGKVRKLLVSQGAQVPEGESLVLVEAMKMEFTIKAPFAGKITRVCVQEGQQLSPGDRLVDLQPEEPSP